MLQEKISHELSIADLQKKIQGLKQDNGLLMEKVQVSTLYYPTPHTVIVNKTNMINDIFAWNYLFITCLILF